MASIREVKADMLIGKLAERLQGMEGIKAPEWSGIVKTGVHKERPPTQDNWWEIRAASMLRKIYLSDARGVERLRKAYGGRKNMGHKPEAKRKASGNIIRKILQQLETAGLVKTEKGKGRVITPKGMSLLDKTAKELR
ncbi:MAG: 30S ribosomal protein S19e [Candidatus Aenigmatarchaeota archaeon]|nr:MAG: 30S ribosomal protein S19e [Candidatus Aenigmarchaeota archaeon]